MCYNKKGNRKICKRSRFFASESSIHASRISMITVLDRVVYVDTSKNEDTWCEILGNFRFRIRFSPESIRRVVVWMIFHTVVLNPNGNRNVLVLNEDGGKRKLNLNYFDNRWNRRCVFPGV